MTRVYVSAVMHVSLERAWAILRDFGSLGNYHPSFQNSFIEDGKSADQIGCVRRFEVRTGGYVREQLLALSDDEHLCRYKILHVDADWKNYTAEMSLLPVTEGDLCFGQWWAEFEVPSEQEAEAVARVAETFRTFFQCVEKSETCGQ